MGQTREAENGLTGQQYITEDAFPVPRQRAGLPLKDRRGRGGPAPSRDDQFPAEDDIRSPDGQPPPKMAILTLENAA
jgi:hypothetical protein